MYQRLFAWGCAVLVVAVAVSASACASTTSPPASTPTLSANLKAQESSPAATKSAPQPTAPSSASPKTVGTPGAPNLASPSKVNFGMIPAVMAAPSYVAFEKGYLKNEAIELGIEGFPDTVKIMTLVATGKLQLGQVTMGVAAFNAFARKADMVIVASANQEASTYMVVRKDLVDSGAVKSVADLKGRKVALNGKGTVLEYSLSKVLEKGNVKMADVDIPILPWPEMVVALQNKAIDAGLIAEPLASKAVSVGAGVILKEAHVPRGQYGTILANSIWARENPQVVVNYLVGYLKALREMNEGKLNRDPVALGIVSKYTKTPIETLEKIPGPYWDPNGRLDKKSIQDVQQFFIENKAVQYTEPIPLNSMIDESYLEKALAIVGTEPKQ